MNLFACRQLVRFREHRTWYRAFEPRHWQTPLSYKNTLGKSYRFSPGALGKPQIELIHFSESHDLTLWEVGALVGSVWKRVVIPNPQSALQIINVVVDLQQVADLSKVSEQMKLETTVQELTGDWEAYDYRHAKSSVPEPVGMAPTQKLGLALFQLDNLEGFRYVSAKAPDRMNLIVFPRKMLIGSRLSYVDSSGSHILPGKRRIKK